MGAWMPGSGLTPGMRLPVRTITVPFISSLKMAFGEPTSSGPSGVTVAALMPKPHSFIAAAASCTTLLSVARRFSSERSKRLNSMSRPVTPGSSTRSDSSSNSWPVWSPSITTMVLRSNLVAPLGWYERSSGLVYDSGPRGGVLLPSRVAPEDLRDDLEVPADRGPLFVGELCGLLQQLRCDGPEV